MGRSVDGMAPSSDEHEIRVLLTSLFFHRCLPRNHDDFRECIVVGRRNFNLKVEYRQMKRSAPWILQKDPGNRMITCW